MALGILFTCCWLLEGAVAAAGPYDAPLAAARGAVFPEAKELASLVDLSSGPSAPVDARAAEIVDGNQAVVEAFRQAAEVPNDGTLFAPRPERLDATVPLPPLGSHARLFNLLLLDAKVQAGRGQARLAEKDLLAAAAFLIQLSEQKYGALTARLVEELCLRRAYPLFAASLRAASPAPAYLDTLAERLARLEANQDFMEAALREEGEMAKNTFHNGVNAELAAKERAKLPFWQRFIHERAQDAEFFSIVYGLFDAAQDDSTRALIEGFRKNAPELMEQFHKKRADELLARQKARDARSQWTELKEGFADGMRGGKGTKRKMAEFVVDKVLGLPPPQYASRIRPYHVWWSELSVLRTALAVKRHCRERKSLPESVDQAIPAFLAAVPRDPFNGFDLLRYAKEGGRFRVWSLGPDGKDEGGAAAFDWAAYSNDPARNAGDIVFADAGCEPSARGRTPASHGSSPRQGRRRRPSTP